MEWKKNNNKEGEIVWMAFAPEKSEQETTLICVGSSAYDSFVIGKSFFV